MALQPDSVSTPEEEVPVACPCQEMTNNNYTISLSAIRTLYGLADMLRRVARMLEHEAEILEDQVNMHIDREDEYEREERINSRGERVITIY